MVLPIDFSCVLYTVYTCACIVHVVLGRLCVMKTICPGTDGEC